MNKYIFILIIPFIFFGCTTTKGPNATDKEINPMAKQTIENPISYSDRTSLEAKCQNLGSKACHDLGVKYYKAGDFKTAINIFDISCAMYQNIPSCVQMGSMFEKGEGIKVDRIKALDIYERACYSGYSQSCKDMKRLQ